MKFPTLIVSSFLFAACTSNLANMNGSLAVDAPFINPLVNKTIVNFGDSIMAGDGNKNTGPAEIIAMNNGMTVYDYAAPGATISVATDTPNNILNRIDDAIGKNVQADYIIFNGLTNDLNITTLDIGTISNGFDAPLDTATFSGAFEATCKKIKLHWPVAKIVYVRVHKMLSRDWQKQIDYGNRATEICEKWSIPVVDMFNEGGLNAYLDNHINLFTNKGDKTHPNELGYKTFYVPMITSKLKTL